MIWTLGRWVLAVLGLCLLADAGLPLRTEAVRVARHVGPDNPDQPSLALQLSGGAVASCSVGPTTFARLQDGEAIMVESTRLLRNCVHIEQDGEALEASRFWRPLTAVFGLGLLAVAAWVLRRAGDAA